jgi:DNA-binding response OmpR family regulator
MAIGRSSRCWQDDYISKSVQVEELIAILKKIIRALREAA